MNKGIRQVRANSAGFSLVELLVVLLILAILVSIAIPSLIASAPERNLAAAGDRFANDVNYCRAKSEATGNNVYLAFVYQPDDLQIENFVDFSGSTPVPLSPIETGDGTAFQVPPNPGVSRVCKEYYIVEERPRWNADGSAYTYLDWLNDYDAYDSSDNNPPYPEPLFPYDALETASSGFLPDPSLGAFNDIAAPLVNHTLDLNDVSNGSDYDNLHIRYRALNAPWEDGNRMDQARKIFCIADESEILALDRNIDLAGGLRTYDPTGSTPDHARLEDQIADYVLLKRVELPEHVYFMNPWKSQWVVGYDTQGRFVQDMQFLQYQWQFSPNGQIAQTEWTYDPEPFPDGSYDGLVHGSVDVIDSIPTVRPFWMVIEECVDFGANVQQIANDMPGSTAIIANNKKTNLSSSARMFTLWSLNGKYYVDEYTPNDSARHLSVNDPRLNLDLTVNGATSVPGDPVLTDVRTTTEYSSLVAREYGYAQDFLFPDPAQN